MPDRVLQEAADVILVDITPDELLQRLKEGKVYVPETAKRATQNFFTPGNLTALRELALRRTADRVDDQMVDYLRQNAIEGPWATSERLLVCVGGVASAELVVRMAARLATSLNASWIALNVEPRGQEEVDPERAKRVDEALRLAERLGGQVERLSGAGPRRRSAALRAAGKYYADRHGTLARRIPGSSLAQIPDRRTCSAVERYRGLFGYGRSRENARGMASVAAPNALGVMDQHGRRARVGRNYRGHGAFAGRMAAAAQICR